MDCFHVLATVNSAAMNMRAQIYLQYLVFTLLAVYPDVKLLDLSLIIWGPSMLFSTGTVVARSWLFFRFWRFSTSLASLAWIAQEHAIRRGTSVFLSSNCSLLSADNFGSGSCQLIQNKLRYISAWRQGCFWLHSLPSCTTSKKLEAVWSSVVAPKPNWLLAGSHPKNTTLQASSPKLEFIRPEMEPRKWNYFKVQNLNVLLHTYWNH